jgi:hypothetical protein
MSTSCVSAINKRIRDMNLDVAKARFQRPMVEVGREVRRRGEGGILIWWGSLWVEFVLWINQTLNGVSGVA